MCGPMEMVKMMTKKRGRTGGAETGVGVAEWWLNWGIELRHR